MINLGNNKGFTILELLVVVAVIGVLAAVSVMAFTGLQRRANESAAATAIENAAKKLDVYKVTNRFYPNSLNDAEVQDYNSTSYQYTLRNDGLYYCLTATTSKTSMFGNSISTEPERGGCPGHGVDGVPPVYNLATNPSMEYGNLGANGWSFIAATSYAGNINSVKPMLGSKSAEIKVTTTTSAESYLVANVAVPKAGTYYVKASVYKSSASATRSGGTCTGGGKDMMISAAPNVTYGCYDTALSAWRQVKASVVAPSAGVIQVRFYPPISGTSTMYVDGLMVSDSDSNYADGNTNGWIWTGEVDNSTSVGLALP